MNELAFSIRTSETRTNASGVTFKVQAVLKIIKDHVERYGRTAGAELPLQELEDLCVDISIKVLENLDRYDPSRASLYTWVSRIAYHAEVDCFKCHMDRVTRERDVFHAGSKDLGYSLMQRSSRAARIWEADAELETTDSLEHIERARHALNPRYQEVLRLTENGAGPKDIANAFGISEGAAATLVCHARKALRKKLEDEHDDSSDC